MAIISSRTIDLNRSLLSREAIIPQIPIALYAFARSHVRTSSRTYIDIYPRLPPVAVNPFPHRNRRQAREAAEEGVASDTASVSSSRQPRSGSTTPQHRDRSWPKGWDQPPTPSGRTVSGGHGRVDTTPLLDPGGRHQIPPSLNFLCHSPGLSARGLWHRLWATTRARYSDDNLLLLPSSTSTTTEESSSPSPWRRFKLMAILSLLSGGWVWVTAFSIASPTTRPTL